MKLTEGYYDMHTHILPGIDDGANTLEESIAMLNVAYQEGIRGIVATPHYVPGNVGYKHSDIENAATQITDIMKENYPDMKLYTGNELYFREGSEKLLKEKKVLTMAESDYILVEFNEQKDYRFIREAIHKITEIGYWPIIAHIERYVSIRNDLDKVDELIQLGGYVQVNTDTITGSLMNPEHRFCDKLLKNELVHFVGSDCHNMTRRTPQMQEAVKYLKKKTGEAYTKKIICDHMDNLLHNKII